MRVIKIGTKQGNFGVVEIGDKLSDLQREVDGYIETVCLPELSKHGVLMIANNEGVIRQLPMNENLCPFFFVGNVLIVNVDGEDFASLTDDQEKACMKWLMGLPL